MSVRADLLVLGNVITMEDTKKSLIKSTIRKN